MKETLTALLASQAFVFERDAYDALSNYLNDIASRLTAHGQETLTNIEYRITELFREQLASPMTAVTVDLIAHVRDSLGEPEAFGPVRTAPEAASAPSAPEPRRLRRSVTNRSLAGVCGGLAEFFGVNATMMRILMLLLIFFGGLTVWAYVVLWILIPKAPAQPGTPAPHGEKR